MDRTDRHGLGTAGIDDGTLGLRLPRRLLTLAMVGLLGAGSTSLWAADLFGAGVVDLRDPPLMAAKPDARLDSGLRQRIAAAGTGRGRVVVQLAPGVSREFIPAAAALGAVIEEASGDMVQLVATVAVLDLIADLPAVRWIEEPDRPVLALTGQGVGVIDAPAFHGRGIDGNGVRVGILDLGFDGYEAFLGTELPLGVVVRSFRQDRDITAGGEPHGTAVAEVVHDVAPGAELYFANFETELEMSAAVDWLIDNEVEVINASFGWTNTAPGDGTGFAGEVVSRAATHGVLWVNSAGNFGNRHWRGTPRSTDGDGWVNFKGADETISVDLQSNDAIQVDIRWDDWVSRRQDFDLYLLNAGLQQVASSRGTQDGSREPTESLRYRASSAGTYQIAIWRHDVTRNAPLDVFVTEVGDPEPCAATSAVRGSTEAASALESLRALRDAASTDPKLAAYVPLFYRHSSEMVGIFARRPDLRRRAGRVLIEMAERLRTDNVVSANLVADIRTLRDDVLQHASLLLRGDAATAWHDLQVESFAGRRLSQALPTAKIGLTAAAATRCKIEHCVAARSLGIPADSRHALAVGATEWDTDRLAPYSSRGPTIDGRVKPDLVAPAGVSSSVYSEFHGTSASAPHVTGAAALLLEKNRRLKPQQIRAALGKAALDRGARGKDSTFGAGRLLLTPLAPD